MEDPDRPLLISRWVSQEGLAPRALAPNYVGIDDRAFPAILADAVHFGGFVRFFDASDQEDGSWEALLTADETAVLALAATMDPKGRPRALDALARRIRDEPDPLRRLELLAELLLAVLRLAADVDRWLGAAGQLGEGGGRAALRLLEEAIGVRLAPRLRRLLESIAAVERALLADESILALVEALQPLWRIGIVETGGRPLYPGSRSLNGAPLDDILDAVEGFLAALAALAADSAAEIGVSLEASTHPPHMGLLMAFIRLFRHAQGDINALPQRIAEFYQREMLREKPAPAEPDSLFLSFVPVPVPAPIPAPVPAVPAALPEIAAGTAFPAGEDAAGAPIQFTADTSLAVTGATIASLRLWQPITVDGLRRRVNAAAVAVGPDGAVGLPLFAAPGLPQAVTGLIVAAPVLELLTGDERRVTIELEGLDPSPDTLPAGLSDRLFRISYSSPDGWVDVPAGDFLAYTDPPRTFAFRIRAGGPPLAAWTGPGADAPPLPAVRLLLDQDAESDTPPLELFAGTSFSGIRVNVGVDNLGGLSVSTPSMPPAPAGPGVAPFGFPPMPGGWLRIDHPAFGVARPYAITFGLTWLGLPPTGFAKYYEQYVIGPNRALPETPPKPIFTDESFTVDVCAPVEAEGRILSNKALFTPLSSHGGREEPGGPRSEDDAAHAGPAGDGALHSSKEEEARVPTDSGEPPALAAWPADPDGLDRPADEHGAEAGGETREEAAKEEGCAETLAGDSCDPALSETTRFEIGIGDPKPNAGECTDPWIAVTLTGPPCGFGDSIYAVNVAYASALVAAAEIQSVTETGPGTGGPGAPGSAGPGKARSRRAGGLTAWLLKLFGWLRRLGSGSSPEEHATLGQTNGDTEALFLATPPPSSPPPCPCPPPPPGPAVAASAMPNPPWRPVLARIQVNYDAHAGWDGGDADSSAVSLFHVVPLVGTVPVALAGRPSLLPALPDRPCFDLAIQGWPAGFPLSLLFRMGAAPGGDVAPSPVAWQRVDAAAVGTAEAGIVADGTGGLSGTGILTLATPPDTADTIWLRAVAEGETAGFPGVVGIVPDALTATRLLTGSETALPPVPAGTIAAAPGTRGISAVAQPLASFGGSPAGDLAGLPARTSARLRHKERAILGWDVERLLLERFPDIARVRVLPARRPGSGDAAPGHMLVIVVPAPGGPDPPDPLRPVTAPELRTAIGAWLAERCSPFARIHVVDPIYDPVAVEVGAFFSGPAGPAMLTDDLAALLSPWAEPGLDLPDDAGPAALQGRIVRFVQSRSYVSGVRTVTATLAGDVPCGQWRVPVTGPLIVTPLDGAPPAAGC